MQAEHSIVQANSRSKPKKATMKEIVWPYELTVDVQKSAKPKICFMSGEERKYYPENPGHSRLGVMDAMGRNKGDSPNPSYYPPLLGVNKPISNKGFGISGLSAERFQKELGKNEIRPEPGTYELIHMYEARPLLTDTTNPLLLQQCTVAFGTHLTVPRFGVVERFKTPGPGSYHWENGHNPAKLKSKDSFGGQKCITPTVITICLAGEAEKCQECGEEQKFDYYRTSSRIFYPGEQKIGQPKFLVLCRRCYCRAMNGHIPQWTKKLLEIFTKARHCSFKHEHQGLPNILTKTVPADLKKLRRKEVIMAKYFFDFCPPEIS